MVTNLGAGPATEANEALARSAIYSLLSEVFSYPTPAATRELLEEDVPFAVAVSAPLPEPVRRALEELAAGLEGATAGGLEAAYRRVFTHVHSVDSPLYETDYTAREIWRQSQELADLAGFYRAFGMEQVAERPDQVAVELEFLHVVAYKAAWALVQRDLEHAEICVRAEEAFLRDHVLKWVPGFVERVATIAEGGPYASAARLGHELLISEAQRLGLEIPEDPAPRPVALGAAPVEEIALCEGEP